MSTLNWNRLRKAYNLPEQDNSPRELHERLSQTIPGKLATTATKQGSSLAQEQPLKGLDMRTRGGGSVGPLGHGELRVSDTYPRE